MKKKKRKKKKEERMDDSSLIDTCVNKRLIIAKEQLPMERAGSVCATTI